MVTGQLIFEPPKFDWHSEDQQQALEEWKGQITLALEASSIPEDKWYATTIGFLGQQGFKHWQNLRDLPATREQENPQEHLWRIRQHPRNLHILLELHQRDLQRHLTGRTRHHWPARPMDQEPHRTMWLFHRREEGMLTWTPLPCDKTLRSQEVGQIWNVQGQNTLIWWSTETCQGAWGNCQGLQQTQVQWRSGSNDHHQWD